MFHLALKLSINRLKETLIQTNRKRRCHYNFHYFSRQDSVFRNPIAKEREGNFDERGRVSEEG